MRGRARLRKGGRFRYNIDAMARYRIIQWRDLPSQVEATDGEHTARVRSPSASRT